MTTETHIDSINQSMQNESHCLLEHINGTAQKIYHIYCPYICLNDIRYGEKFTKILKAQADLMRKNFGGRVISVRWSNIRDSCSNILGNMGRYVLEVKGDAVQEIIDRQAADEMDGELREIALEISHETELVQQ